MKRKKSSRLITLGSFDGFHLGHKALVSRTVQEAMKRNLTATALTFRLPPRMILNPSPENAILSTEREKEFLLKSAGLDEVVFLNFTPKLQRLRPYSFFRDILLKKFQAKGLIVGLDFKFGVGRSGGVMELLRWGMEERIPIWIIPPVRKNNIVISSTGIRQCLREGDFKTADALLGHPYLIRGKVAKGRGLGRKLGFPTTNLEILPPKVLPKGVFVVQGLKFNGKKAEILKGICNIGVRPTFYKKSPTTMEIHWLSGVPPRNDQFVLVELLHLIRAERKFRNSAALVRAIENDLDVCRRVFSRLGNKRSIFQRF